MKGINDNPFSRNEAARIIVGLPHLSDGKLLANAELNDWPVMVSASSLAKWETITHRGSKARLWKSWNTKPLDRIQNRGIEIHLDSAGFVAMALRGGYDWTVESYIHDLASHPAVSRFSSMDMCVEPEVAPDRIEVRDRIARTIALNHQCHKAAKDAGSVDRLMPVIQGVEATDYLRCFDAISNIIPEHGTIGVGSMCRRKTSGSNGSIAIIEALDRQLPKNITFHLFGVKSDSYEAMAMFGSRVSSVDSQSYGTRARCIANEKRKTDPSFSKTDAFVAEVMSDWYAKQSKRLENPRSFHSQTDLFQNHSQESPKTVLDAAVLLAREEISELIEEGQMDHNTIIGPRMLEEWASEIMESKAPGLNPYALWEGQWVIPDKAA